MTDTHLEILKLIRQCERHQRERLLKAMQEDPVIAFPRATLVRWLVSAVLTGVVVGSGLAYLLVPKGGPRDSRPAEAYIDAGTGKVISEDSDSQQHGAGTGKANNYQPAFYCWKCRQWLPVKKPQDHGEPAEGPLRAFSDRPTTPRQK